MQQKKCQENQLHLANSALLTPANQVATRKSPPSKNHAQVQTDITKARNVAQTRKGLVKLTTLWVGLATRKGNTRKQSTVDCGKLIKLFQTRLCFSRGGRFCEGLRLDVRFSLQ